MTVYLRNAWYPAAWDDEVTATEPLARQFLDERVVLFRAADGTPRALSGVCPHRLAPLGRGQIVEGNLHCGYHGLGFDATGACVHNPFGEPPANMRLTPYPVVERWSMIWIWLGDPAAASPELVPDFSFNDPEASFVGKGYLRVSANYELEIENILDLSHIQYLHPTTLGSGEVSNGVYRCLVEGETVWSNRDVFNEVLADEMARAVGLPPGEPVDRWINVRWNAPASMAVLSGSRLAGRPREEARETPTTHLFAPETNGSTHYFYGISFPRELGAVGEQMAQEQVVFLSVPFQTEDLPMLQDQQANVGDRGLRDLKMGWLPGDEAGMRARRILYNLIDQEAAQASKALAQAG